MVDKFQRPLILGGITLVSFFGLLELLDQTVGELGAYALLSALIGAGVWWVQRQAKPKLSEGGVPRWVDAAAVKQALGEADKVIARLKLEADDGTLAIAALQPQVSLLQTQSSQLAAELERDSLRLIVMGNKGSGKTALIQYLQSNWLAQVSKAVTLYEAPSFSASSTAEQTADAIALKQAMAADLVLFLVTGDLTESELQRIKRLATQKRLVLVFNKQDQFLPDECQSIVQRMQDWVQDGVSQDDVVAIATAPKPLKVRQHQADGGLREWAEAQPPQVSALIDRLNSILRTDSRQLVMASSLTCANALKTQAAATLNEVRRIRALPAIEQFQWIAAATAFASPVPTLDVVATAAINVQMILDLGAIYQQKFSLDQAQKAVTTLGGLILKLGLVELSTRTIASLLKTNLITYVAGGCIQAASAAYLTRVVGLALVDYFQTQDPNLSLAEAKPLAIERLSQILQAVFQQNQQSSIVRSLIGQVSDRLAPKESSPQTTAVAPIPSELQPLIPLEAPVLPQNGTGIPLSLPDLETLPLHR